MHGTVIIYAAADGRRVVRLTPGSSSATREVRTLAFRESDGLLACGSRDGTLDFRQGDEYDLISNLEYSDAVTDARFHPETGVLLVTSFDGTLTAVDADAGRLIWRKEVGPLARALALAPGGLVACSGPADPLVLVYSSDSGARLFALDHSDEIYHLSASGTGLLATFAADQCLYIWDLPTQRRLDKIQLSESVFALEWSRDSSHLLLATDRGIESWAV